MVAGGGGHLGAVKVGRVLGGGAEAEPWVDPAAHNTAAVRLGALALSLGAAAGGAGAAFSSTRMAAFVHLTAYACYLGSMVWTTFIAGITMFKNLPRKEFGKLQAKLFPLYFALHAACLVAMGGALALGGGVPSGAVWGLGLSLAATAANLLFVEPKTTANMFARYAMQEGGAVAYDEGQAAALKKEFGLLHGLSSLLNLGCLCYALAHGWRMLV